MRIRVFLPIVIICIVLCIIDSIVIVFPMLDADFRKDIFLVCLIIFMMGVLPLFLLIWCIFTMSNIIEFDEKGVRRIRFGRVIREFSWEKVKTISCTENNSFAGWVYISEKEKKYDSGILSVSKMRLDREVIYFHLSKKAQEALLKYAPNAEHFLQ